MILGGSFLGVSTLTGLVQFPEPSAYTAIRINGEAIYDYVWSRNFVMTDAQIRALELDVTPVFDGTTIMLANFNNNLGAGSVDSITNPITSFDVNRRKSDETTFTLLDNVASTVTSYNDVTAEPNVTYIYEILAKNATEISEPLLADPLESDFYNWLIIDPETATTYVFNLNLQSSAFANEIDYNRYDGYNKYSPFTFGDRDFLTGSVSAILASNNEVCGVEVEQSVEFLDQFRAFINNKKEKILKSRKGHVIRVVTTDYNSNIWLDELGEQLYRVSFNFTEVGAVHGS